MNLLVSILVLAAVVMVAYHYWQRLTGGESPEGRRRFEVWAVKGLGVPLVLWTVFNSGATPVLPPLVTQVILGQVAGGWWARLAALTGPALLIMASYWGALTFAWLVVGFGAGKEHGRDFAFAGLFWCVLLSPLAWFIVRAGGWEAAGFAGMLSLVPVVHFAACMEEEDAPRSPLYTRAIANMKFGRYSEAEAEVIRELENCENDFDGWLMLAGLYAEHFHDLAEADRTLRGLLNEPNITPAQASIALHRLADWHLKLGDDPVAARRALEEIGRRMPGTHLAHMAGLRLGQLPATAEELAAQRKGRTFRMPALNDDLEASATANTPKMRQSESLAQADRFVEVLRQDPNDVETREKLARLMAEQLGRADLAVEQLEMLIAMPEQPAEKIAECLAVMAAWQITHLQDKEAAKKPLERLVREVRQPPQAFAAQRRWSLLAMEARVRKTPPPPAEPVLEVALEGLDLKAGVSGTSRPGA